MLGDVDLFIRLHLAQLAAEVLSRGTLLPDFPGVEVGKDSEGRSDGL